MLTIKHFVLLRWNKKSQERLWHLGKRPMITTLYVMEESYSSRAKLCYEPGVLNHSQDEPHQASTKNTRIVRKSHCNVQTCPPIHHDLPGTLSLQYYVPR